MTSYAGRPTRGGQTLGSVNVAGIRWLLFYGLVLLYLSTVLGPSGLHFVPIGAQYAWQHFVALMSRPSGGIVREDWIGNLLVAVPLGFLAVGVWYQRSVVRRIAAVIAAFGFCLSLILAIKFAQLYFPPRTVAREYVVAQGLGALIGIGAFVASRPLSSMLRGRGRTALVAALVAYTVAFLGFIAFPFDPVQTLAAVQSRLVDVTDRSFEAPDWGRLLPWPPLAGAYVLETVPIGALIAVYWRRPLWRIIAGVAAAVAIWVLQLLLMHGNPSLATAGCRALGLFAGGAAVGALHHLALLRWRLALARAVPLLAIAYVLLVLLAKDVIALDWRTPEQAWAGLEWRGLWPFWHAYIVSKSRGLSSMVAHLVIFLPIGAMVWVRRGAGGGAPLLAATLAVLLSLAVETGRWFRPGLQPDITNLIIAGVVGWAGVALSERLWHLLIESFPTPGIPASSGAAANPLLAAATRSDHAGTGWTVLRLFLSAGCFGLACMLLTRYPLSPWGLAALLFLYVAVLARWPAAWLVVVPAVLPALDLAMWTGWFYVGEADLFILVTVGVLVLRSPPTRTDFVFGRLPLAVLLFFGASQVLSILVGLFLTPALPTDNPYLSAWNAVRVGKGFFVALLLLPFLRAEIRLRADALWWLGGGMIGGLLLVSLPVIVERWSFVGLFDFVSDYRVVGTFSSMHIGGGHLAVYLAMALPFSVLLVGSRRGGVAAASMLLLAGGYALVVTYSRTGYVVAASAMVITGLGSAIAARRKVGGEREGMLAAVLGVGVPALVCLAGVGSSFMQARLGQVAADLTTRERAWQRGLQAGPQSAAEWVYGTGLGSYPRLFRADAADAPAPSDYRIEGDGASRRLVIRPGDATFYFGQKIPIAQPGQYMLDLALRSSGGATVSAIICEKLLLYSVNCTSTRLRSREADEWTHETAVLDVRHLAPAQLFGWIRRPVDLAFHAADPDRPFAIAGISLIGQDGRQLVSNGDFRDGTARWYFTDDSHWVWRMFNQFAMLLFEQGVFGFAAFLLLTGAAIAQLSRAIIDGDRAAVPLAASIVALVGAGLFEAPLEAPRLGTVFFLLCFAALSVAREDVRLS
jgi:VanZ family protein